MFVFFICYFFFLLFICFFLLFVFFFYLFATFFFSKSLPDCHYTEPDGSKSVNCTYKTIGRSYRSYSCPWTYQTTSFFLSFFFFLFSFFFFLFSFFFSFSFFFFFFFFLFSFSFFFFFLFFSFSLYDQFEIFNNLILFFSHIIQRRMCSCPTHF